MNTNIGVCLVARNRLLREVLARLLSKSEKIAVRKVLSFIPEGLHELSESDADVIILDSLSAEVSGRKLLSEIHRQFPLLKIILIDMDEDPDIFFYSVCVGAAGYLLKDASAADVVAAVRAVAQDEAACPPRLVWALFEHTAREWSSIPQQRVKVRLGLTRRQQQLIPFIAQGLTNKEIGAQLHLSEQTVKNHIHRMLRRVGANDRLAVVELARDYAPLQMVD